MSALFLTGGSGFIGRAVRELLVQSAQRVVRLQRAPADGAPDVIQGDLLDPASYASALHGIDTVVHLAAATGRATRADHFRHNAEATERLVEASRGAGVRRILFISSIAVRYLKAPHYHYAAAKRVAESAVRNSGLRYTILRPTIVLGPGSPIGAGFRRLASLPVMPLFGNGRVRVQPIDVRDVATLIRDLIDEDWVENDTMEAGGPDTLTLEQLLQRLHTRMAASPARMIHLPLAPIRTALALAERVSPALAPVTAGQLAAFANDSVAEPHAFVSQRNAHFRDIDRMLDELAADG